MIINFRFSDATELIQTIGRGNRNPFCNQAIVSHVFVESDETRIIPEMVKNDLANQDIEAVQTLCAGLKGLVITALST